MGEVKQERMILMTSMTIKKKKIKENSITSWDFLSSFLAVISHHAETL